MEKKDEKILVYKPNQTIMMTNGKITLTQRKAYNVILHKAYNVLKNDINHGSLFMIDISDLKNLSGIDGKDDIRLKNEIKKLRKIDVEIVKKNGDWAVFGLISGAEKRGDKLVVELPHQVRQALIDNTFYTTLDLMILKGLEGKYAIILYEMAIRYKKAQIPEMTIEEFRNLTGTEDTYSDFGVLRHKVLTPALEEINSEKTDILLEYTTTTRGKKTLTIKFTVKSKENREIISASDEISATSEVAPVQMTLDEALDVVVLKENISKILEPIGVDAVELIKAVAKIDSGMLKEYVSVIKGNKDIVDTKIGSLIYALNKNMSKESFYQMLLTSSKKQKKPSNRDNFDSREYPDEYFDNFFNNVKVKK